MTKKYKTPILVLEQFKKSEYTEDDMIVDPDNNELLYAIRVTGLDGYKSTPESHKRLNIIYNRYYRIMVNQKALLNQEQISIMKMQILLWFRECVEDEIIYI